MCRSLIYFLFASSLLAQGAWVGPLQAPIDALIGSYQSALSNGNYDEAAAKREQARALLGQIPADDPQFANWAQRVSQQYDSGGFGAQARGVLEQAISRAAALGDASQARVALLGALANSWRQDRNLLQALNYTEQAVAAAEAQAPPTNPAPPSPSVRFQASIGVAVAMGTRMGMYPGAGNEELYQRLFSLYHELGRPQDAAAVLARIGAHVKNSDGLMASLYQQQGQTDEAAAIYKRMAAESSDLQQASVALQSLANLYQSQQRYGDAAAAMQDAIGKMDALGQPGSASSMRQWQANMLQQAGQIQAADEVYGQLMAAQTDQNVGIVASYANFLAQTNRAGQAETLLKDYQAGHSTAEPWRQNNLLMAFANVERIAGKPQLAEEYQRQAIASQPQPAMPAGENRIADTLQRALSAANAGKLDEAFNLTVQALDSAPGAADREWSSWTAVQIADSLSGKATAKADEIYRRLFALTGSWSAATVTFLLRAEENYARSLQNRQRWGEFDQALGRYSATLTAAQGAGTGLLEDVLRLRTAGLYRPERQQDALVASEELVKLEESLSGPTSAPYLRAVETLTTAMESGGDRDGALPLHRKMVTIADLVYGANHSQRATVRINAAMALARAGQFDEAEALAGEAVAIGQHMQPKQPRAFTAELQRILQMKRAAQATAAPKQ